MSTLLQAQHGPRPVSPGVPEPAVALLLHGYGSNEQDLVGLADALELTIPWVSLRAPLDARNGAAWFAITTPGDPAAEPVSEATAAIWAWVDAHLHPATRIVPIGFSQGGLMASQLLRTRPERVLAPVVLGGFILGAVQPADEQLRTSVPQAFWGRGDQDPVITPAAVARTAAYLPAHTTLTSRVYAGLAHGINGDEVADVQAFLSSQIGSHPSQRQTGSISC